MGPGTKLEKRLKRGDPGINRLDRIAKQHDIDYSKAKNLQDKWKADAKMIESINKLPGCTVKILVPRNETPPFEFAPYCCVCGYAIQLKMIK